MAGRLKPAAHRGEIVRLSKDITIIDDSYNANPTATRKALDVLSAAKAVRRVAVIGEMLELGEQSIALHEQVGRAAAGQADMLVTVGGRPAEALAHAASAAGMPDAGVSYFADQRRGRRGARRAASGGRPRAGQGFARRSHRSHRGSAEGGARLMLFYLLFQRLYLAHPQLSVLNVTRYTTFRTAAASLSALAISLALGQWMIRKLREFQIGQVIRQEGPTTHRPKAGTPTMGGLLILTAALVPTLLWADLRNPYVWIAVLSTAGFGAIGFLDDYLKIVRRDHHGLRPRYKLGWQVLIAGAVGAVLLVLQRRGLYDTRLVFPFDKTPDSGSRDGDTCRSPCSCWWAVRTPST